MIDYQGHTFLVRIFRGTAVVVLVGTGLKLAFSFLPAQFWSTLQAAFNHLLELAR